MKQHITDKQLNEFLEVKFREEYNKDKYSKLYEFTCPQAVVSQNFTIGKLFEIINDLEYETTLIDRIKDKECEDYYLGRYELIIDSYKQGNLLSSDPEFYYSDEIVDTLWKALIDILGR